MISVEDALDLVESSVKILPAKKVVLKDALGLILAEDVHSPIDMPPFAQSAMDGYAVNFSDDIDVYALKGEIQAGQFDSFELGKGEAVRIFTGAAVPDSANMVVRQEDVAVVEHQISFVAPAIGANIRPEGEQINVGELALTSGTELTPASIGFLATLGFKKVNVFPRPDISILTTGNELVKPGEPLKHGQIYESNSTMLEAAFNHFGFRDIHHVFSTDDYQKTVKAIQNALASSDLLLLSGGISVGDYDFVYRALNELGVAEIFYKVNQKPGKPLYFGKLGEKLIFALPGNPAAALTSFYIYILPSLNKLTGGDFRGCAKTELPISADYKRKGKRTEFLKAIASTTEVEILDAQSSAMLSSFSHANALVVIPDDADEINKGDFVLTFLL